MSKLLAYMCLELSILSSVIGLLLAMTTIHLVKTNTQKAKKCVRTNIDGPIGSFDLTEERPADCCEGNRVQSLQKLTLEEAWNACQSPICHRLGK